MAPASTFHRLTTASAQISLDPSPKLQAYTSTGCPLDLVPWGPSGHLSPYICHFSDSLSRTATRSYPDPHPLFHLTSHQIPGFGLLSLSSTYTLSHLPEPRLSRHRSGQPHRAPWLQACPVCSVPHPEAWGIVCKCKSDHITLLLKILQRLSPALTLALGLTWCGQVLPPDGASSCMPHSTAAATGKSLQCRQHTRLLWPVAFSGLCLMRETPSLVLHPNLFPQALQPLTLQSSTAQEPQSQGQKPVRRKGRSGSGGCAGVAGFLGCGTPEGQEPPTLGALRLWTKGLS